MEYHNLIIYIDKDLIRFSTNIGKGKRYQISFYVSIYGMDFDTGKKIEKVVNDMIDSGLDFVILPLPRCLFRSGYPETVSKRMVLEPRKFLLDGCDFRFLYDEEIQFKERLNLFERCVKCTLRKRGLCEGIYGIEPERERQEKTTEWLFNEVQTKGEINLLDLGCGDSPFIEFYKQIAIQNHSLFFCLDPSDVSINLLNNKIPKNLRPNILSLMGTGEHIPFKSETFDYVLFQYSYSHIIDIEKTMENLQRILKKGGLVLIFEDYHPSKKANEAEIKRTYKDAFLDRSEVRNHSLKDAIEVLKKQGFEILDSFEGDDKENVSWGVKVKKL